MNAQNAILRLSSPMLVRCVAAAMVMSSLEGLERPAEDAEQDDRGAHERERQPVGEWREREDWQAQRRDERPDRPPGTWISASLAPSGMALSWVLVQRGRRLATVGIT